MPCVHTNFSQLTLCYFFFFWVNKTFCSSHPRIFRFTSPSQNPKSFLSFNIQLPSSSMNAMEFQKNLLVSMVTFIWVFLLDRFRFDLFCFRFLKHKMIEIWEGYRDSARECRCHHQIIKTGTDTFFPPL